jgi:hypothetical protein
VTPNDIEDRLRSSLKELTDRTPIANPDHPREDHATGRASRMPAHQIDPTITRGIVERTLGSRETESTGAKGPSSRLYGRGRILIGATTAVLVIAAFVLAVVYGPRSSDVGGSASSETGGKSVVGSYTMTYLAPKTPTTSDAEGTKEFFEFIDPGPFRLAIDKDGTFRVPDYLLDGSRSSGTWKESHGSVTLRFTFRASSYGHASLVQTAQELGSNLGSFSRPGVVVSDGKRNAGWYAVRNHGRSGFDGAKAQWMGDGTVAGTGGQDQPLQLATADLQRGEISDAGSTSDYGAAVTAIKRFESMPITGVTPAISDQETAQIATINTFFGLPPTPWPGECESSGPGVRAAATAWGSEPAQSGTGVVVAPLAKAVNDLRRGLTTDRGDTSCYPAAIIDIQNLESATRTDLSREVPYGDEIGYLNQFFHGLPYVLGGGVSS